MSVEDAINILGNLLGAAQQRISELCDLVTVRHFCSGLASLQEQDKGLRFEAESKFLVVYCNRTGEVLADGTCLPEGAKCFFALFGRLLQSYPHNVRFTFSQNGVSITAGQAFMHFSAEDIAFAFAKENQNLIDW